MTKVELEIEFSGGIFFPEIVCRLHELDRVPLR